MYKVKLYKDKRIKRKLRIKQSVSGTGEKPRLTIFRSNVNMYAQLIDDQKGHTILESSTLSEKLGKKGLKKSEEAFEIGKSIGKRAVEKGIKQAVFDRNGYRYHGRVKSVAEGAREGGLQI